MKRELKIKNVIIRILLLISCIMFIIEVANILTWYFDNDKIDKQIDNIEKIVDVKEIDDTDNIELSEQDNEIPKEDPYWDYIKMNMIDVDLSKLKTSNQNVIGWIQVNGTNINYPFVQAKDNKYYLTHSFDKSTNKAGWVFLDYRNNSTNNRNTILYAHSRVDKTMFGSLKNILSNGWLNDKNNYVIKISTPKENTLWQVFSVYHIPTTNDYLQTKFTSEDQFLDFVNKLKNRSAHDFKTTINKKDHILTLSTCYSNNEKLVLHAKLIKRQVR